jgi:hypothetical protein
MNVLAAVVLGVIAIGVYGLSKLGHASGQLTTQISGRIFKLDLTSITVAVDTTIKNPTHTEVVISYPFIKLLSGGSVLASSDLKEQTISIKPYAQTSIKNIQIPINFLSMGSLAPDILKRVKDKTHKIKLQAVVSTQVSFAGTNIPYSYTQDISI